jgi:hypothetical protein
MSRISRITADEGEKLVQALADTETALSNRIQESGHETAEVDTAMDALIKWWEDAHATQVGYTATGGVPRGHLIPHHKGVTSGSSNLTNFVQLATTWLFLHRVGLGVSKLIHVPKG